MSRVRYVDLPAQPDIARILIMKWSAMGDVALASAAIEDVYRAFPGRRIDLDTLPPWHALYADDPRFEHIQAHALRARGRRLPEGFRWLRQVAAARYDLVVDLQTTDRSRIMIGALALAGRQIPYRLGNKPVWPYNIAPAASVAPRHALQIARDQLRAGGIAPSCDRPVLHPSVRHREQAARLAAAAGLQPGGYAVFLPGCQAAGYLKRWGAARYTALARGLLTAGLQHVVLLGGPDEREECAAIAAGDERIVNLSGQTELLEVTVLCERAAMVVGNDTGTAHLASACDTPLYVICGPTDPRRVKPAGPQVVPVQVDLPCINCYRKHCAHHSCMRLLTPQRVLDLVLGS